MRPLLIPLAVLALMTSGAADAADAESGGSTATVAGDTNGLFEFKRQNTSRGTPEETTKTNLKFDYFPPEGVVSLLRLELPFPDKTTTFAGNAFDPAFGDAKTRVGFRAVGLAVRGQSIPQGHQPDEVRADVARRMALGPLRQGDGQAGDRLGRRQPDRCRARAGRRLGSRPPVDAGPHGWRPSLGKGVPSTYETRVELKAVRRY